MSLEVFIKRPILASVCSFLFVLGGMICIPLLPVAQYPDIAPPQVQVQASYLGANADTVESGVTIPLEQVINGVEGIKYMTSTSSDNGSSQILVTIDPTRDLDNAIVDIQNRIKTAEGRLPDEVRRNGITVEKYSSGILLVAGFYSEKNLYDSQFISNYVDRYVVEALKRIKGIGQITLFGERKFAMRLWIDSDKLALRGLTAIDLVTALNEQNVQVAAGQIGQVPIPKGQMFQMPVKVKGRLENPEEFGNIILKKGADGALVKVRDIGRVELGAEDYTTLLRFNGNEDTVGMLITQLPSANAIEVDKNIHKELEKVSKGFPKGMKYQIAFNPTEFVQKSIEEVIHTLFEALIFVILVIFIFLQKWRSILIPAITVPVSLVGTFIFVKLFGFSINTLTLFGLTLATGLVVDDAIVVMENIERLMEEKHLSPFNAAVESMKEITGAVIATSLVLMTVFIPVAFFPGSTGELYKQFALTIAFSIGISMFNALTLSPALSALLLRHHGKHEKKNKLFQYFDAAVDGSKRFYSKFLFRSFRVQPLIIGVFIASILGIVLLSRFIPQGFVPTDDQGYLIVNIQAPSGSSLEVTGKIMKKIEKRLSKDIDVGGLFSVGGFSFFGAGANKGTIFVVLKPLEERPGDAHSAKAILNRIGGLLGGITEGIVIPFEPPAISGLGSVGGFQYELLAEGANINLDTLAGSAYQLMGVGNKQKELTGVFTAFQMSDPQLKVDVDRDKAKSLGVSLSDIFTTMQVMLGSLYVNDFELLNRVYRVYIQADQQFRVNPSDISRLFVRSSSGSVLQLSNLVTVKEITGPPNIYHFNLFRSVELNGSASEGHSLGQAMDAMKRISSKNLPKGLTFEWSGLAREQMESGSKTLVIFLLGLIFVFLILAAQYESLVDPLIILMSVPMAIFGGLLAQFIRGLENDVFCQVGLLMLVGLASKNAILIVEFANQLQARGYGILRAVIKASKTRYRPIMMTSLAFIFGIIPLVFATGAGAYSRHSLGTAVFGGMIVSTALSLFIVPIIYFLVNTLKNRYVKKKN